MSLRNELSRALFLQITWLLKEHKRADSHLVNHIWYLTSKLKSTSFLMAKFISLLFPL